MPWHTITKKRQSSTKTTFKNSTDLTWSWIWQSYVSNSKDSKELKGYWPILYSTNKEPLMTSWNNLYKLTSCCTKYTWRRKASSTSIPMKRPERKSRLQLNTKNSSFKNSAAKAAQEMMRRNFTPTCTTRSHITQTLMKRTLRQQSWCLINVSRSMRNTKRHFSCYQPCT